MDDELKEFLDTPVEELMKTELITLEESKSAAEGVQEMEERAMGYVLVTRRGELVGIVTERDILYKVVARFHDPSKVELKEIVSSPLLSVSPKAPLREAIALMSKHKVRRLLVKDDDKPLGILSQRMVIGDDRMTAIPLAEVDLAKGVRCPFCDSQCPDKGSLSKHIDRIHIGSGLLEGDTRQW